MQAGLAVLCLAYVLSQFFRAFLAVLSQVLAREIGAGADDLAFASGLWFLSFAAMQLPVGWALDRIGPRRTTSILLLAGGGGGAAVFALAVAPWQVAAAMFLIGVGCSPILMASYYIFARQHPPEKFATLAALIVGVGSAGNLVAAYPTALATESIGWRATLAGLALLCVAVALGIWRTVEDPEKVESEDEGSVLDLLKMPVLWAIIPMMFVNYAPPAAVRGLWIGPYLSDIYGLDTTEVGTATLIMAAAMIAGTFTYGPLDRVLGTRKWLVVGGNALAVLVLAAQAATVGDSVHLSVALLAATGFLGGSFPVIMAHGRAFVPPHLAGRGVTLLNLFAIGGVAIMQFASGRLHASLSGVEAGLAYQAVFVLFAVVLGLGCVTYLLSRDNMG